MVTLHSVRRVLAIDLGMDPGAIEACLAELASTHSGDDGAPSVPLAEVLRLVARAEAQAPAA